MIKECGIPSTKVSMRINFGRVILGGIVAGTVGDISFEGLTVNGAPLSPMRIPATLQPLLSGSNKRSIFI